MQVASQQQRQRRQQQQQQKQQQQNLTQPYYVNSSRVKGFETLCFFSGNPGYRRQKSYSFSLTGHKCLI